MSFLKRAILAVTRRKGKTVIMFIIFAAIANLVLAGFSIQHATKEAGVLARQKLGGQLTLRYNMQAALQQSRSQGESRPQIQAEPVTEDMAKMIANQKDITDYNLIVNANGSAQNFKAVATDSSTQQDDPANGVQGRMRGSYASGGNFVIPDVTVTGVASSSLFNTFSSGEAKLLEGRQITPDDAGKKVAIIEKNLADQNGIKAGDKIDIKATRSDVTVEYTVIGIYQAAQNASSDSAGTRNFTFTEPYNRIFVDYKSAIPLKTVISDTGTINGGIDQAVFNVDDPQNIDTVIKASKSLNIDWSKFTLDANDSAYQQMMGPINNVASFSMTVIYIVAIAGALILALLLMLSIKERMYETGVLLSMGEGKLKVIAQYLAEVLLIAIVAFSLSAFSGRFIAQGVGNMLLNNEIKVEQNQSSNYGTGIAGGGFNQSGQFRRAMNINRYQAIDSLNIQITAQEMEQMAGAGLLIIIAGILLPASTIMRYKPKAILTKAA